MLQVFRIHKSLPPRPNLPAIQKEDAHLRVVDSLVDFASTYTNLEYGNITLCSTEDTSPSSNCSSVIRDFAVVDKAAGTLQETSILAHWPRVWNSHLVPNANRAAALNEAVDALRGRLWQGQESVGVYSGRGIHAFRS